MITFAAELWYTGFCCKQGANDKGEVSQAAFAQEDRIGTCVGNTGL